jgi:hypothetical protein
LKQRYGGPKAVIVFPAGLKKDGAGAAFGMRGVERAQESISTISRIMGER